MTKPGRNTLSICLVTILTLNSWSVVAQNVSNRIDDDSTKASKKEENSTRRPIAINPDVVSSRFRMTETLQTEFGFTVGHNKEWIEAPSRFTNAHELIRVGNVRENVDRIMGRPLVNITIENRIDFDEALQRMKQLESFDDPPVFKLISGWPAMQFTYYQIMDGPSADVEFIGEGEYAYRSTTVIAYNDKLVRIHGTLTPDQDPALMDEILAISDNVSLPLQAPANLNVQEKLTFLRNTEAYTSPHIKEMIEEAHERANQQPVQDGAFDATRGGPTLEPIQRIQNGNGVDAEVEIAVSNDGQHVVVVNNSRDFATSNDYGESFGFSGVIPGLPSPPAFGNNGDPSVAWGQSGNFYFAFIGFPANACSTGISRSTDNGQTWNFLSNATVCNDNCFTDQEHLAADRVNASNSNQDLVYSTWRNFSGGGCGRDYDGDGTPDNATGGPEIASLVCSSDSGVNWSGTTVVDANGVYPRITVAQDGFVYVVYRDGTNNNINLHKFGNCDTGLTPVPGFPQTVVAGLSRVTCPSVPGLDRCNSGSDLSSQMVAVDDTNANHIFVAYSVNTTPNVNENVIVQDSLDGGATWPRSVQVSGGGNGRRFMSWICTTRGRAYLSWFDSRAAFLPNAATNDLTDYYCSSAFIDGQGNLAAGAETRITPTSDPLCASGWPNAPRAVGDSESCTVQPQLAGICTDNTDATMSSGIRCDFSDCGGAMMNGGGSCQCPADETCNLGRGIPKYGDYNGNACAFGYLYTAWPSATSYAGIAPASTSIDTFFTVKIVDNDDPECDLPDGPQVVECMFGEGVLETGNSPFITDPEGDPIDIQWLSTCANFDDATIQNPEITVPFDGSECPLDCEVVITGDSGLQECEDTTIVRVQDTLDPSFTVDPMDEVIECDPATNKDMASTWAFEHAFAEGEDLCSDVNLTTRNTTRTEGCGLTFRIDADIRVTDACGNFVEEPAEFSVIDTIPPVITCPTDPVELFCVRPDGITADEAVDFVDALVSATDICSNDENIIIDRIGPDVYEPTCGGIYPVNMVTFVATDECGLQTSCMVEVEVKGALCCPGEVDTELTLMPADLDVSLEGAPVTTKAKFDIWNQNEIRFSGTQKCITCWDETLLGNYNAPNHFKYANIQTDVGKARVDGLAEEPCNGVETPLFGVLTKEITFAGCPDVGVRSAITPRGIGAQSAVVEYSPIDLRGTSGNTDLDNVGDNVAGTSKSGSLIYLPKVEIKWDANGNIIRDTIVEITNDGNDPVKVLMYLVNGEPPLAEVTDNLNNVIERGHDGWNFVDVEPTLTQNHPNYVLVSNGEPLGFASSFINLDGGLPLGRPDLDPRNPGGRMLRGFFVLWAVDSTNTQINWNYLSATANILDYDDATSHEYNGWTLRCHDGDEGSACGSTPGTLLLNGSIYDAAPDKLMFEFFAPGSYGLSQRDALERLKNFQDN